MSSFSLALLKNHGRDLRQAELAALLHDMGKCTSEFACFPEARSADHLDPYKAIFTRAELRRYKFSPQRVQERLDESDAQYAFHRLLTPDVLNRLDAQFSVGQSIYTIREAIYFSRPRFACNISGALQRPGQPLDLLAYCHGEAHVEKESPYPPQKLGTTFRDSVFGYSLAQLPNPGSAASLTMRLTGLDWARLTGSVERGPIERLFREAVGDTRFPINDVTLWDWSYVVASLYKSELARHFITGEWRQCDQLGWRLLRVNFDVLQVYAKAIKIADLLAYKHAVNQACETVKHLVEDEYPLGNEVYRDTTGIYFTFPDLDLPAELRDEIRRRVEEIEPELTPRIAVGTGSGHTASEQLKSILCEQRDEAKNDLTFPVSRDNYSPCWEAQWENLPDGKWEVCPVCRLRPKEEVKDTCQHCLERRQSRIDAWKQEPAKTIWLDEIADHNDRIALLVGKFDLEKWLSGDLVQTMLVQAKQNDPEGCKPKNPSPARLRRVWETCQRFWADTVENTILEQYQYANDRSDVALRCSRLFVTPDHKAVWRENVPYDGTIGGQPISLLWRNNEKHFVTIINLQLAAGGAKTLQEVQDKWSGQGIEVSDPDNPRKRIQFKIDAVARATDSWEQYRPYLTLLTSPDQFLAFIPASESLAIAERIRQEYQRQFGKVQNRLPLFLGLVFFQHKTPLMAVMDTARRMLKQLPIPMHEETWTVECSRQGNPNWHLRLSRGEQRVSLDVPVTMGDGTTEDAWYPYFFVENGVNINGRLYRFQHNDGRWLVHVKDLHEGDRISITPSRFAYLFLEHTAQRFRFNPDRDVSLLDELPLLIEMWERLHQSGMTDTDLRSVAAILETKAEMWGCESQEFLHLTETTLKVSGLWQRKDKPDTVTPEEVLSGRFSRCLELYLRILKARLKKENDHERQPATV